jgi:hypothetical protein
VKKAWLDFVAPWHVQLSIIFGSNHEVLFGLGEVTEETVRVGFAVHDVNAVTFLEPFAGRFDQLNPPLEFAVRFPVLLSVRIRDWITSAENRDDASNSEWCASLTRSDQRNVPVETLRGVLARTLHPPQPFSPRLSAEAEARRVVDNQDPFRSFCSADSRAKMRREQRLELDSLIIQKPVQRLQVTVVRHDFRKTIPRRCGYRIDQSQRPTI